jgi:hypothetical protein
MKPEPTTPPEEHVVLLEGQGLPSCSGAWDWNSYGLSLTGHLAGTWDPLQKRVNGSSGTGSLQQR